jgi:hypothetical protein
MHPFLAIRIFFLTFFSSKVSKQVAELLAARKAAAQEAKSLSKEAAEPSAAESATSAKPQAAVARAKQPAAAKAATRSDALTFLAALQREARFVDFVQESLEGYSDAQVGAAARDVHRDCAALIHRVFALQPATPEEENAEIELPAGFDAGRWRLTGNVTGEPPFRGHLIHPGWEAAICELPTWRGSAASAKIVAPAEVELR